MTETTQSTSASESAPLILSVSIPTYNRASLLRRCLDSVAPQTRQMPVEIVIVDNASTDNTGEVVREYMEKFECIRYVRNPRNLGYSGSQAKCIESAKGKYTAILCDDDVYTPEALQTMVPILSSGDYSFVALNYFGFVSDPKKKPRNSVAPEMDLVREDALEVWDYPCVGHYSGFVLNTSYAQSSLPTVWETFNVEQLERFRGILSFIVVLTIGNSKLPGYFIGKRVMGAGEPPIIDYDSLRHLCIDTYFFLTTLVERGFLPEERIQRRKNEILQMLPKALIRNGGYIKPEEMQSINELLDSWFQADQRFTRASQILGWMKFGAFRALLRSVTETYKLTRRLQRRFNLR